MIYIFIFSNRSRVFQGYQQKVQGQFWMGRYKELQSHRSMFLQGHVISSIHFSIQLYKKWALAFVMTGGEKRGCETSNKVSEHSYRNMPEYMMS